MKKRVLWIVAVFLLLAVPAVLLNMQQGVFYGDDFLRRNSEGYGPITMVRTEEEARFSGTLQGFSWQGTVRRNGDVVSVSFPDGTSISGYWNGEHLCDPSGMPYAYTADMITIYVNGESNPPSQTSQADLMCRMAFEQTEQRGHLVIVLIGAAGYLLGLLCVLYPDKMYFQGGRWMYDHVELSDMGRFFQRLGGCVCMVMAVVFMYLPLFYFLMD